MSFPKAANSPSARKAWKRLKEAAATGDVTAKRHYAIACFGGVFTHTTSGKHYSVPVDHAAAATLFEELATNGDDKAARYLAHLYLKGQGVPESLSMAQELLKKAAEAGNREAAEDLQSLNEA